MSSKRLPARRLHIPGNLLCYVLMPDDSTPPGPPPENPTPPPSKPGNPGDSMSRYAAMFSPLPPVAELGQGELPQQEEKLWATFCHLGALLGFSFLAPLVIYLIQKDKSPFVASHAKESLNFQITYLIVTAACIILMWLVIPVFIAMAAVVFMVVMGILASIRANDGGFMALPFTIRFIK